MDSNYLKAERKLKEKHLFVYSFALLMVCKCLNISEVSDYVPYSVIYAVFIGFWGGYAVINSLSKGLKIHKHPLASSKILIPLLLYYIIWGLSNLANIDQSDAIGNMARSMLYVAFIATSIYWVKKMDCLRNLINTVYFAFVAYLFVWLVISLPEINPVRTFSTFWISNNYVRYRNYFGFSYPNIAGELAIATILISKLVTKKEKSIIAVCNCILFFIELMNNSRGSLLAFLVFEMMEFFFTLKKRNSVKAAKRVTNIVIFSLVALVLYLIVVRGMTFYEILAGTNREAALEENMRLLRNSGRWLMGVGRLTGGFFSAKSSLYGTYTGYLEVFYFEVFITTGIIGSIFMALILGYMYKSVWMTGKREDNKLNRWVFEVFIYMLFISMFEVYIFSYIYASSMVFTVIILSYVDTQNLHREGELPVSLQMDKAIQ